ncbi:HlyD family secretion protein [Flavicella sediminum]|uniref:HlyD family secretion protein n=1 Tax=Flavicella sediminum TaxID=2585141 RepID=UPI001120DEDD|nr:biotin/lipoyl-binding protein [Flavicella sediminum]
MKSFTTIFILCTALVLNSCGNNEEITAYRGKVKFETIAVSSKIAGRIDKLYVKEGQTAKKGDTLALLDIPEVNAKMMQVEGAITSAKGQLNMAFKGATVEQLDQLNGKIDAANAQLEFAQNSYKRIEAMYVDSLVSMQQFDEIKMKRNMAQAQINALQAKKEEISKSVRTEQIDQAKGQLDRALGAKEEIRIAANEKYLVAAADMTIETISLEEGELLTPGYTLINGYKKNSLYFRFTVPESKIYDFEVGKTYTLVNPYTQEEINGKIEAINQLAQYADISSTAPLYELSQSIYELKILPTSAISKQKFYLNATILIK